jgi:gamma-glutamylcyclotransferase (GGCT)/AIG2-like uncharacterized protein YtfP
MKTFALFVYGSLKEGGPWETYPGLEALTQYRIHVEPATLRGFKMYDLGYFPAIIEDSDGVVHGEIHVYDRAVAEEILRLTDQIESVFYRRIDAVAITEHGETPVIVYVWAESTYCLHAEVPNGIWEIPNYEEME